MRSLRAVLTGVVLVVVAPETARAFDSLLGMVHGQITKEAAGNKGYSDAAIATLQGRIALVDYDETDAKTTYTKVKGFNIPSGKLLVPNATYRFSHHFDRGRADQGYRSVADTFKASAAYVAEEVKAARKAAGDDKPAEALKALGRSLHAIQDLNAHSNLVDLPDADQARVLEAVFDGGDLTNLTQQLKLTAYVTTDETEFPTDDPLTYTHGAFAKDTATKNDDAKGKPDGKDKTRYELAFASGVKFSERLLEEFAKGIADAKVDAVKGSNPPPEPSPETDEMTSAFMPGTGVTLGPGTSGTTLFLPPDAFDTPQLVRVASVPLHLFRESESIRAVDGRGMGLVRDIGPQDVPLAAPGAAEIAFRLDEFPEFDPDTLQVYRFDSSASGAWVYAPNAAISVDEQAGTGFATFGVPATGFYGIGGFPGEVPPGAQHPVVGTRLRLLDAAVVGRRDRLDLVARDPAIVLPAPGAGDDPTRVGATLAIVNPTTGEFTTFTMPPSDGVAALWWRSESGYTLSYRNLQAPAGGPSAVRSMLLRPGRLKVRANGLEGYTLDEVAQGRLIALVSFGLTRYCADFVPHRDRGLPVRLPGEFVSNEQPAPATCVVPTPSTTTTLP